MQLIRNHTRNLFGKYKHNKYIFFRRFENLTDSNLEQTPFVFAMEVRRRLVLAPSLPRLQFRVRVTHQSQVQTGLAYTVLPDADVTSGVASSLCSVKLNPKSRPNGGR